MYHANDISSNLGSICFQIGHISNNFWIWVGKSNGFLQKNAGAILSQIRFDPSKFCGNLPFQSLLTDVLNTYLTAIDIQIDLIARTD